MQSNGPEHAERLGAIRPVGLLPVARVMADHLGVATQVGAPGLRQGVAGRALGLRRPEDEVVDVASAHGAEGRLHALGVLQQAQVAARLEQVGADRHRAQPAGQEVGHVEGVGTAGEGEGQLAGELVGQGGGQVDGHGVQGATGHVHRRVALEDAAPVAHLQGVGELQAEDEVALPGGRPQSPEHGHRVRVAKVMPEGFVRDGHVRPAQVPVDDAAHALRAEQGGVALHRRVQAPLVDEVARDALDLVRRAAVHRGEGHRVRDARRDVDVAHGREAPRHDVHVGGEPR